MLEGNPARYLAPAALVVAAVAILLTWQSSVGDDPPPEPSSQRQATETTEDNDTTEEGGGEDGSEDAGSNDPEGERPTDQGEGEGETYTVQPGDTLSTIATRTGVDVETLIALNEGVNPQNLQAGDELALSP